METAKSRGEYDIDGMKAETVKLGGNISKIIFHFQPAVFISSLYGLVVWRRTRIYV